MSKLYVDEIHPKTTGGIITTTGLGLSNIKEQFVLVANGESITVPSGTYTPINVTTSQLLTDSHVVINGSSLAYTPPSGTTDVIYEFSFTFQAYDTVIQLMHYAMRIDGTQITGTKNTYSSDANYGNNVIDFKWRIPIGGSASTSTGRVASWTSAKTIDMTIRRYNSSYTGQVHRASYWDGASAAFFPQPIIKITALG
jgi:hypothetical protein